MVDRNPNDDGGTHRHDRTRTDRSEKQWAQVIDWKSAIAACPGPLYAELDGLGSEAHLTIEGDDFARRIDLIQHIDQQYELSHVGAVEVVEYAITLEFIDAMLDHQVVYLLEDGGESR